MKMKSKTLLLTIVWLSFLACKEEPIVDYQVIPQPNSIIYTNGVFSLKKKAQVYFTDELEHEAELLKEYLGLDLGVEFEVVQNEKNADIILELNKNYNSKKMMDMSST